MRERERGDGRVFKRGSIWWIAYWHRGKEHRESSGSEEESAAAKMLKRRMKEIGADQLGFHQFNPKQEKLYVADLLDSMKAEYIRKGGRSLPQFEAHLKPIR